MLLQKSRIYEVKIFEIFSRKSLCKNEEEKKLENEQYFIQRVINTENKKILLYFILPEKSSFFQRILGKVKPSIIIKKSLTTRLLAEKGDLLGVKILHKVCGDNVCTGYGYSIESNNTELIDYCENIAKQRKIKAFADVAPFLFIGRNISKALYTYLTTIYNYEPIYMF